jgi:hypothetical protein
MKKVSIIIAAFELLSFISLNGYNVSSRTFFSVPSHFQSFMPERVSFFRNELLNKCPEGLGGAFQAVIYGSQTTTEGSRKLARYFLPNGCNTDTLTFREFNPAGESTEPFTTQDNRPTKDVDATHFNIRTVNQTFASRVLFKPEQSVFGIGLTYKQKLTTGCDGFSGFWLEGAMPIERVRNHITLVENILNDGGGPILDEIGLDNSFVVGTVKEAFAQKNWRFGKIECHCPLEKWGIADIELKAGYTSITVMQALCETCSLNSYLGILIPTGTRVKGQYVFEPIVGNNRHFAFIAGNSIAFETYTKHKLHLNFFLDANSRYLFSNKQIRSFDLVGKPWGRYMEVYNGPEEAAIAASNQSVTSGTSGINVFTRCVQVSNHFSADINSCIAASYDLKDAAVMGELGFNLFARQAEVVDFFDCSNILNKVALKAVQGLGGTNNARTIKNNFTAATVEFDQSYLALNNCDIDPESAAHPTVISHIAYLSLGYRWNSSCPGFIGIGVSCEFALKDINSALERWTLWGKFGITF